MKTRTNLIRNTHSTQSGSARLHPLIWFAGVSVTLASAVAVAAIMGWIPSASSSGADVAARNVTTAKYTPPAVTPRAPAATRSCNQCGTVESVNTVRVRGEASGAGAVIGGVLGGVLGHQVGSGRGNDAATVVGAVGGAVAGNNIEKNRNSQTRTEARVRIDDGTYRTLVVAATSVQTGDRVRVEGTSLIRI